MDSTLLQPRHALGVRASRPTDDADWLAGQIQRCVHCALEAHRNGEQVVLAECQYRIADLIPKQWLDLSA
jgi:hypothetical protein